MTIKQLLQMYLSLLMFQTYKVANSLHYLSVHNQEFEKIERQLDRLTVTIWQFDVVMMLVCDK